MKICQPHWDMCRASIEEYGLSSLVSRDGAEAVDRMTREIDGEVSSATFDPLMSMNNFISSEALRNGGLYVMGQNDSGENDGHYCPVCEFVAHSKEFDAKKEIDSIAAQMVEYARSEGLIPKLS